MKSQDKCPIEETAVHNYSAVMEYLAKKGADM